MPTPNDSILNTIKALLNIESSDTDFDTELILDINSCFAILNQIGLGPTNGFKITGSTETWSSYIGDNTRIDDVVSFVHLKTKMLFDPPTTSSHMQAYEKLLDELTWRLNVAIESPGVI